MKLASRDSPGYSEGTVKMLNRLVLLILLALAFALSGGVLWAAVSAKRWGQLMNGVAETSAMQGVGLATAFLFLLCLYLFSAVPRRSRRRVLSFDNEGGTVSISTDAICDYLAKLSSEFPAIVKLMPEVISGHQRIDLRIGVRIRAGSQVHEVCELLQQRVRESVTTGLGISQVGNVEVSVMDIVSEHKPQ